MFVGGQVTGILSLQNVDEENAFTKSHVRLLQTLAASMSVALENARLWEQENLYRKALERNLRSGARSRRDFTLWISPIQKAGRLPPPCSLPVRLPGISMMI